MSIEVYPHYETSLFIKWKPKEPINICRSVPTFQDVLVYQLECHLRDEDIQMLGERLPPRCVSV